MEEDYKPPDQPQHVAFTGQGMKLGSTTPTEPSQAGSASVPQDDKCEPFELDESQPTTSLQLRLMDGTRMVAKFNHSHRIRDIRQFLDMSRPRNSVSSSYQLVTAFPTKPLVDESQTLKDAGLLNAVIMQKAI